jgi:glycosyltransferase involved in cell wall biosynthesis
MNILALVHGLGLGGAQISTLEQLELLKKEEKADIEVVICYGANKEFINRLSLVAHIHEVPCTKGMGYPIMDVREVYRYVERTDIIWITDIEFLSVPHIKGIKNKPIIAHLHSYALICPWWGALYGFREPCPEKCSSWRNTRCKQGVNLELAKIGLLSSARARLYWLLDFAKGPLDFFRWSRLMNGVVESIDGFIAVSKALWNIHVHHLPSLSKKSFSIVYNLVTEPLNYVKPNPHEPYGDYILYASGANPVKGPHLLLEAWQEVSKEFKDLKLYMVGCKDTWVESKARQMNLRKIEFMERLPPDRRYYYLMYKAKAVVMPSLVPEAFGRIPVEANRLGVPAIVNDRGALPEIIEDDVTGIVTMANSNDLAKAIAKVVSNSWDRSKIIEECLKRINPHNIVSKMLDFFEMVSNKM